MISDLTKSTMSVKILIFFVVLLSCLISILPLIPPNLRAEEHEYNHQEMMTKSFMMTRHYIKSEIPSFIHIMFQVTDISGVGIQNLKKEDFDLYEDGKSISPTESALHIKKREEIPYVLKTVLMLDNSMSVGSNLSQIKKSAVDLIDLKLPVQQIAIYKFSEEPVLVQDFTADKSQLKSAINSIELGFATTDFYGAVITGVSEWEDTYSVSKIQQGFLIILTDGSDTQGSHTLNQALSARNKKMIYTIGVGNEIEPDVLNQLGNAGFYSINNFNDLSSKFIEIQNKMILFANSFYWLNYLSPKRGDKNHTLKLMIKDNQNNSYVTGNFNSKDFFSVRRGVYVNLSKNKPEGIAKIAMYQNVPVSLKAVSCYGDQTPQYVWNTSHPSIINFSSDRNSSIIEIMAISQNTEEISITVEDVSNHFEKTIDVMIESFDNADKHLIAHYPFNSNGNDQSGYRNHATIYNAALTEDRFGKSSSAYYFSGGDYIDCGNDELFNLTAPFSISLWIYASPGQTGGKYYNIIAKESVYSNGYGIELYGKRRMIQFWVVNEDNSLKVDWVYGSDSDVAKKWIHLVGVHTGSKLQFYVNNKLVDQDNINFMANPSDFPLRIGRSGRPLYYDAYFHGKIDDVYIFNRVLTPAEISFLFKNEYIVKVKSKYEQNLQKYKLNVNYPNPFNPKTVITYEIPQNEHVVLRITDILGRKVENLVNGHKKAGFHSVSFNAENLAGGVYFYTLTTGSGMTMTQKMLLLK